MDYNVKKFSYKLAQRNTSERESIFFHEQEYIPVGCVPSAAVAAEGGWVSARRVSARGVCLPGGCLPEGWRCVCPAGRCVCPGDGSVRHPVHPVNRMTDRRLWKYYLVPTSMRTVTMSIFKLTWKSVIFIAYYHYRRVRRREPDEEASRDTQVWFPGYGIGHQRLTRWDESEAGDYDQTHGE